MSDVAEGKPSPASALIASASLSKRQDCAVVLRRRPSQGQTALLQEFFPGWRVVTMCEALAGVRLSRVVMLALPSHPGEAVWFRESLMCRLAPGKEIEWLA